MRAADWDEMHALRDADPAIQSGSGFRYEIFVMPRIVTPNHPVLDGIQPFQVWDETYVHTKHNPDRTVLMERVDESGLRDHK